MGFDQDSFNEPVSIKQVCYLILCGIVRQPADEYLVFGMVCHFSFYGYFSAKNHIFEENKNMESSKLEELVQGIG